MVTVPEALTALGNIYAERNKTYGDDYKRHGMVMTAFFPTGLQLRTVKDFNRAAIFKMIVTKVARYAANFDSGGHRDSLNDLAVYAQMLQELDDDSTCA